MQETKERPQSSYLGVAEDLSPTCSLFGSV